MTWCVTFDIDDTLYLERSYVRSGFRALDEPVLSMLGVREFSDRAWSAFERGVRGRIFDVALTECGVQPDPAVISELVGLYRRHVPAIELLADARACIVQLAGAGVAMAAVSDGPLESQRAKAEALGLSRWMAPVVLTAALGPGFGKPHPRGFELVAAEQCGAASHVYVADNPHKDFAGPRQLGWRTVRIRRPLSLHHDVPSGPDVDFEISDLSELAGGLRIP